MSNTKQEIIDALRKQIENFAVDTSEEQVGTVLEVADGIARMSGLSGAQMSEMLLFPNDVYGVALNLEEDSVGAVILGDASHIKEGDTVKTTGRILSVPISDDILGRVVDPLGMPIDGKGKLNAKKFFPIEKIAPGVMTRKSVGVPLQTGIKAIDSMIPVGRGQRELIIGDRQTGKIG